MTDFDQENGPTFSDLLNSKKVKIAILAALAIAIILAMLDIIGLT